MRCWFSLKDRSLFYNSWSRTGWLYSTWMNSGPQCHGLFYTDAPETRLQRQRWDKVSWFNQRLDYSIRDKVSWFSHFGFRQRRLRYCQRNRRTQTCWEEHWKHWRSGFKHDRLSETWSMIWRMIDYLRWTPSVTVLIGVCPVYFYGRRVGLRPEQCWGLLAGLLGLGSCRVSHDGCFLMQWACSDVRLNVVNLTEITENLLASFRRLHQCA